MEIVILYRSMSETVHSNSKFLVSATETFRKTTFTEVSSSKILPEISGYFNRNFGFFDPNLRFSYPKLRVFENRSVVFLNQSCSFCKESFFRPKKLQIVGGVLYMSKLILTDCSGDTKNSFPTNSWNLIINE
jgi:hypothetical protein